MSTIRQIFHVAALAGGLVLSLSGNAQAAIAIATPSATPAATATSMTEGEVRKVDKENKKITLKHGEIKNLEMPAMTMVFQVKDPTMLEKVKAGDKVRFAAVNDGGGITVTDIQPAK